MVESLLAQVAASEEGTRWLAFGSAVFFALTLLRVLVWYQRTFLNDARTELAELRERILQREEDHDECLRTSRALAAELGKMALANEDLRHEVQVLKRQLAEAMELPAPRPEHTRRDDPNDPGEIASGL